LLDGINRINRIGKLSMGRWKRPIDNKLCIHRPIL